MKLAYSEYNAETCLYFNEEDLDIVWGLLNYFKLIGLKINYSSNEYGYTDKKDLKEATTVTSKDTIYPHVFYLLDSEIMPAIEYLGTFGYDTTIYNLRRRNDNEEQREPIYSFEPPDGCGGTGGREGVDNSPQEML